MRAEQEALDAIVADLSDERWGLATPSPGWSVADQIGHLTYFDGAAATAITDPAAFTRSVEQLVAADDRDVDAAPPPVAVGAAGDMAGQPPAAGGRVGHPRRRHPGRLVRAVDGRQVVPHGAAHGVLGPRPGRRRRARRRAGGDRPAPPHRPARCHHPGLVLRQPRPRTAARRRAGGADRAVRRAWCFGPDDAPVS